MSFAMSDTGKRDSCSMNAPSTASTSAGFSGDFFRAAFENSGSPVIIIEKDTTISCANIEFCKAVECTKEEIEGKMSWTVFCTEDMLKKLLEYHYSRRSTPEKIPSKYRSKLKATTGKVYDVLVSVSSIPGSDRTVASFIDISDRINLERGILERDNAFMLFSEMSTIFEAIPGIIALISPDLKIVWTSRKDAQLAAEEGSSTFGRHCYEVYHARSSSCEGCPIVKCYETGKPQHGRISADNGMIWDIKGIPIKDEEGNIICAIDLAEEVTEVVKLETESRRAAQLASIGELAAGVAHEINNPVNGIINYAQLLLNRKQDPETADISTRILHEGHRIAEIVRSLLSFARHDETVKSPTSVSEILQESMILGQALLKRDKIKLNLAIASDLPLIYVNARQIEQVFLNLVSNAHYALAQRSPEKEERTLNVSAELTACGKYVQITFVDNGIGIPAAHMEKIMMPFFTTKPHGKGTGLGLSISHGIISDHNGNMSIFSMEGQSTTVTIDLPVCGERR